MPTQSLLEKNKIVKEIKFKIIEDHYNYDISSLSLDKNILVFLLNSDNVVLSLLVENIDYTWNLSTKLITFLETSVAVGNFVIVKDDDETLKQVSSFLSEDMLLVDTRAEVKNIYNTLNDLYGFMKLRLPIVESSVHKDMLLPALPTGAIWYYNGNTMDTLQTENVEDLENSIEDRLIEVDSTINNYSAESITEIEDYILEYMPDISSLEQHGNYPYGGRLEDVAGTLGSLTKYLAGNDFYYLNKNEIAWDKNGVPLPEPDMVPMTWQKIFESIAEAFTAIGEAGGTPITSSGEYLQENGWMYLNDLKICWQFIPSGSAYPAGTTFNFLGGGFAHECLLALVSVEDNTSSPGRLGRVIVLNKAQYQIVNWSASFVSSTCYGKVFAIGY